LALIWDPVFQAASGGLEKLGEKPWEAEFGRLPALEKSIDDGRTPDEGFSSIPIRAAAK